MLNIHYTITTLLRDAKIFHSITSQIYACSLFFQERQKLRSNFGSSTIVI